jgi:hypothetical protein
MFLCNRFERHYENLFMINFLFIITIMITFMAEKDTLLCCENKKKLLMSRNKKKQ